MLTTNLKGELGNNLFQIAMLMAALDESSTFPCKIKSAPLSDQYFLYNNRDCYISTKERPIELPEMFEFQFNWTNERIPANRIVCKDNDNSDGMNWGYDDGKCLTEAMISSQPIREFDGYFQSPLYFDNIHDDILNKYFVFKKEIRDRMDEKYGDLSNKVALHVRRGGDRDALKYKFGGVTMEYYQRALNLVLTLTEVDIDEVLIFSDDPSWCESVFDEDDGYRVIRGNKNYEDMYLMTQCAHVILANSTFSWWGAYLNQRPNKIVIYPANEWFGPGLRHLYTGDMFPTDWIGV